MKRPAYRDRLTTGIVHFGPGAFHRAHQADYWHRLAAEDPRWGVAAISLRSPETVEGLRAQDGLYTLAILDAEPSFRTIGVHSAYLGPTDAAATRALLAAPTTRIVTSTVTEKGYCFAADGSLDFAHPDIVADLANPANPRSLIGWIALGLADRRAARIGGLTILPCDNMQANGRKVEAAVRAFAARIDPDLARWIAGEVRVPNTMVDSITPATTDALRARVLTATGVNDHIPVSREAYTAWIIEDALSADAPDLAGVGAVVTGDVSEWERAKLRLLNGPHSTLAYLGLLLGHRSVADVMRDPMLAGFVERMMLDEIAPALPPGTIDLAAYSQEVLARFRNPAIEHLLSQIAWDGSQKLPYRLLDTMREALAAGRPVARIGTAIAGWLHFIRRQARAGIAIVDPLAADLATAGLSDATAEALLADDRIFPTGLATDPRARSAILGAFAAIERDGVEQHLILQG